MFFITLKELIIQNIPQIIAFMFFIFIVVQLTRLSYIKGTEFWEGIKGENGVLDPEDLAILMWTILFPVLVLSDVFLGLDAGQEIWWSMNGILGLILGYKGWGKNGHDEKKSLDIKVTKEKDGEITVKKASVESDDELG